MNIKQAYFKTFFLTLSLYPSAVVPLVPWGANLPYLGVCIGTATFLFLLDTFNGFVR
jgi:hypothetical protein